MRFENALYHLVKPVGDGLYYFINHPVDAVVNTLYATSDFIQDNPYTSLAIVGLGAYAYHKGYIRYRDRKGTLDVEVDTCIGGASLNTSLWCGRKRR